MKKSLFIVVEGIDRSGKSSLVSALENTLIKRGFNVHILRYPNRLNNTGKLISEVLSGNTVVSKETAHLLFSANRWEDKSKIEELLNDNLNIILCDRYILSGISYSLANGLPEKFIINSDKGMTEPDLTLFLDVSPTIAAQRSGFGEEIYEKREFQESVYIIMKELLEKYNHKIIQSVPHEEMHRIALEYILELIRE